MGQPKYARARHSGMSTGAVMIERVCVAVALALALAAGCGTEAAPTASPSGGHEASASASASPTATPSAKEAPTAAPPQSLLHAGSDVDCGRGPWRPGHELRQQAALDGVTVTLTGHS